MFEFACDGSVAERTEWTFRNARVLVVELWQIAVFVARQPACMVPLSTWISPLGWIHSDKISILIRKPELANCVARVNGVEGNATEKRVIVVFEKPFDVHDSRCLAKGMTDHCIVVKASKLLLFHLLHC